MAYTLHAVNHCKHWISLANNNLVSCYLVYWSMYLLFFLGNLDAIEFTLRFRLRTVNDQA